MELLDGLEIHGQPTHDVEKSARWCSPQEKKKWTVWVKIVAYLLLFQKYYQKVSTGALVTMTMRKVTLGGTVRLPAHGSALCVPKSFCCYSPVCLNWGVHSEMELQSAKESSALEPCWRAADVSEVPVLCAFLEVSEGGDPDLLWPDKHPAPGYSWNVRLLQFPYLVFPQASCYWLAVPGLGTSSSSGGQLGSFQQAGKDRSALPSSGSRSSQDVNCLGSTDAGGADETWRCWGALSWGKGWELCCKVMTVKSLNNLWLLTWSQAWLCFCSQSVLYLSSNLSTVLYYSKITVVLHYNLSVFPCFRPLY